MTMNQRMILSNQELEILIIVMQNKELFSSSLNSDIIYENGVFFYDSNRPLESIIPRSLIFSKASEYLERKHKIDYHYLYFYDISSRVYGFCRSDEMKKWYNENN